MRELPPFGMAAARWTAAGLALYAWRHLRGEAAPTRTQWKHGLIGGAFLVLGGNGLVCWAEARVDSGLAATILAITPVLVVVLEWLAYRGARPTARTWAGVAAGVAGVAVLVGPRLSSEPAALAALLLAAACWAVGALHTRHAKAGGSGWMQSATQMIAGGALLGIGAVAVGEPLPRHVSLEAGLAVGYLAVFGSIVGFGAYLYLARTVRPSAVATHSFVNPAIAVLLGGVLLGESLDGSALVGAGLVVASVAAIVTRPRAAAPAAPGPVAESR